MMHTVPKAWEYIRILRGYDLAYDRSAAFSALKAVALTRPHLHPTLRSTLARPHLHHILRHHPSYPQIDGNLFRASRLYNEDVDILLQDKMPMLQAIYDHYKALAVGTADK